MEWDRVNLQNGVELSLSPELVAELERVVRDWRRQRAVEFRPLGDEIAEYLRQHPSASVVEVARALRARDQLVRETLRSDLRFQRGSPPPGASRRLKSWMLAGEAHSSRPIEADE